jgi:hypothetical protein
MQLCLGKQHGQECCHRVQYCTFVQTIEFLTMDLIGIEQHGLPGTKRTPRSPQAHLPPFAPALNGLKQGRNLWGAPPCNSDTYRVKRKYFGALNCSGRQIFKSNRGRMLS